MGFSCFFVPLNQSIDILTVADLQCWTIVGLSREFVDDGMYSQESWQEIVCQFITIWLVVGTLMLFVHMLEIVILIDELIFSRGVWPTKPLTSLAHGCTMSS